MQDYRHILIALDASKPSEAIALRALKLSRVCGARLSLLRVLEHLPSTLPVDSIPPEGVDKIEWLTTHAGAELKEFSRRLGMSGADINVALGSPKQEITRIAREQAVDLVVVGAHERHWIALLRGSTTDGVVHQAPCDVLAVHL